MIRIECSRQPKTTSMQPQAIIARLEKIVLRMDDATALAETLLMTISSDSTHTGMCFPSLEKGASMPDFVAIHANA